VPMPFFRMPKFLRHMRGNRAGSARSRAQARYSLSTKDKAASIFLP